MTLHISVIIVLMLRSCWLYRQLETLPSNQETTAKLKISLPNRVLWYEGLEVTGWGMANPEHLAKLWKGVEAWNQWQRENQHIRPDLSFANLSKTNLRDVDFRGADLRKVDLNDTDLREADLRDVDLRDSDLRNVNLSLASLGGAVLHNVDLSNANLCFVRALGTKLGGANLTGACIEDWHINSRTVVEGVICQYIYLRQGQQERRPLTGTFGPGDFAKLVQKAVSTIDLIFRDGINWEAFAQSFDQLRAEAGTDDLAIQAIENKSDDSFVIRVNTPLGADNAKIQQFLEQEYQKRLKVIEDRYRIQLQAKDEQLDAYRQQNTDLIAITKLLASKPPSVTQNIGTAYGVSGHTEGDQNIHPPQES